ncbi:NAD-dependent epimerase/dehydratase [Xylanimonas cellulosilytica DSM 15894]|uniref:NAD-dependent epimerase/dehydratase n=1 Tax=Xylanimonas cellulosilytica (strain DSM 15894 / JCM 12276 / CECT 5975 / KCTC 9989 / LMG 20990 / NBRC 107835 / XIL07) TaxID=446471 RepID=D1BUD2_XYLCX|nr:NAD(P)H-binding protein [Xylanimonas cellulosilytica]ACZ31145.1 NAD-dependent epimerase/dehydratase [Xylanimonas cellulosilytica DSM 15894]
MATDLVTGANGYTGSFVAQRLLDAGHHVRTLTRDPGSVVGPVEPFPYRFDDAEALADAFRGVDTFYNTYWMRFVRGTATHDVAVTRSRALVTAAARAGVRRVVHVGIMNPDVRSPYSYHRGKALAEQAVREAGPSFAIVRPSVLFGGNEVLLNNIAWLLRHLHVFAVPGDGRYPVRPTHVEDLADLMVALGARDDDVVRNAGGPETFEFGALVRLIRDAIGARALVVDLPRALVLPLTRLVGLVTRDVTVHPDELDSLMEGLASCDGPAAGSRRYTDFLAQHREAYGRTYTNEVRRNFTDGEAH